MPSITLVIACLIGMAVGFCNEWRKYPHPTPETRIRWCRPSSTDPACKSALENYERELAKERYVREYLNPALSSTAGQPPR